MTSEDLSRYILIASCLLSALVALGSYSSLRPEHRPITLMIFFSSLSSAHGIVELTPLTKYSYSIPAEFTTVGINGSFSLMVLGWSWLVWRLVKVIVYARRRLYQATEVTNVTSRT